MTGRNTWEQLHTTRRDMIASSPLKLADGFEARGTVVFVLLFFVRCFTSRASFLRCEDRQNEIDNERRCSAGVSGVPKVDGDL